MVKRLEALVLVLFPLIALSVIVFLFARATAAMDDAFTPTPTQGSNR